MPSILADPADPNRLFFCADHLWTVQRTGPGSYTYAMLPQDFASTAGEHLTAFAISPVDPGYLYAATNLGALWYSHDAGSSWSRSANPGPEAHFFYGTDLLPSPTDAGTCFVGGSGYSNPAVYRTVDGGVSWSAAGSGLPSTLVLGLALSNDLEQVLYAATEAGPYRLEPGSEAWTNLLTSDCCAPLTTYWDVEALPHQGLVRFATYGRGIWDYITGSVVGVESWTPSSGVRLAVYPSPAVWGSTVEFELPQSDRVTVEVFDVAGHRVAVLADGIRAAGSHRVGFGLRAANGRPLDSGIYLVRAATRAGVAVRKLYVVR